MAKTKAVEAKLNEFIDDKQQAISNDIEKIQMKMGMYIGPGGRAGALHLVKETINNWIDECINPRSVGNRVTCKLDMNTNTFSGRDNGREIGRAHV